MKIALIIMFWYCITYATKKNHNWEPRISLPGQCGPLEYYNECGSSCKTDCYTIQVGVPCVTTQCLAGCYCRGGFLRNGKGAHCVKESKCHKFHKDESKMQLKEQELNNLIEGMLFLEEK